jgi:hypothetical protein
MPLLLFSPATVELRLARIVLSLLSQKNSLTGWLLVSQLLPHSPHYAFSSTLLTFRYRSLFSVVYSNSKLP